MFFFHLFFVYFVVFSAELHCHIPLLNAGLTRHFQSKWYLSVMSDKMNGPQPAGSAGPWLFRMEQNWEGKLQKLFPQCPVVTARHLACINLMSSCGHCWTDSYFWLAKLKSDLLLYAFRNDSLKNGGVSNDVSPLTLMLLHSDYQPLFYTVNPWM